jgi:hypothetical protein
LASNLLLFLPFGILLERAYGAWRLGTLLLVGVLGGVAGGLLQEPGHVLLGASGGVFALVGGTFVLAVSRRNPTLVAACVVLGTANVAVVWNTRGVSAGAHAGGLVVGLALGALFGWRRRGAARWFAVGVALIIVAAGVDSVRTYGTLTRRARFDTGVRRVVTRAVVAEERALAALRDVVAHPFAGHATGFTFSYQDEEVLDAQARKLAPVDANERRVRSDLIAALAAQKTWIAWAQTAGEDMTLSVNIDDVGRHRSKQSKPWLVFWHDYAHTMLAAKDDGRWVQHALPATAARQVRLDQQITVLEGRRPSFYATPLHLHDTGTDGALDVRIDKVQVAARDLLIAGRHLVARPNEYLVGLTVSVLAHAPNVPDPACQVVDGVDLVDPNGDTESPNVYDETVLYAVDHPDCGTLPQRRWTTEPIVFRLKRGSRYSYVEFWDPIDPHDPDAATVLQYDVSDLRPARR